VQLTDVEWSCPPLVDENYFIYISLWVYFPISVFILVGELTYSVGIVDYECRALNFSYSQWVTSYLVKACYKVTFSTTGFFRLSISSCDYFFMIVLKLTGDYSFYSSSIKFYTHSDCYDLLLSDFNSSDAWIFDDTISSNSSSSMSFIGYIVYSLTIYNLPLFKRSTFFNLSTIWE
jgi:hypothetical protein